MTRTDNPVAPDSVMMMRDETAESRRAVFAWRREQRAAMLAARLALPMTAHRAASRDIAGRLSHLLATLQPRVLGGYWPIRREFSPLALMREGLAANLQVALPVVRAKNEPLEFRLWTSGARMTTGVYNIPYPADGAVVAPDTLLIPMLGFDSAAYRLGYGGGYYDRTVASMVPRPRLIGLSFEVARMPTIHPLSHDMPMDWVITEQGTYPAARG